MGYRSELYEILYELKALRNDLADIKAILRRASVNDWDTAPTVDNEIKGGY